VEVGPLATKWYDKDDWKSVLDKKTSTQKTKDKNKTRELLSKRSNMLHDAIKLVIRATSSLGLAGLQNEYSAKLPVAQAEFKKSAEQGREARIAWENRECKKSWDEKHHLVFDHSFTSFDYWDNLTTTYVYKCTICGETVVRSSKM